MQNPKVFLKNSTSKGKNVQDTTVKRKDKLQNYLHFYSNYVKTNKRKGKKNNAKSLKWVISKAIRIISSFHFLH